MRQPFLMPDLGLDERSVRVSDWHVACGRHVVEGDRLLEVMADSVIVDLPAPQSGVLVEQLVHEDDPLRVGQQLGTIEAESA